MYCCQVDGYTLGFIRPFEGTTMTLSTLVESKLNTKVLAPKLYFRANLLKSHTPSS